MKREDVSGELLAAANQLFGVVEEITGAEPQMSGKDRYKACVPDRDAVYISIIERGGSKNPPHSIWLHTGWNDRLAGEMIQEGDNWYGDQRSAELTVLAGRPQEVARAEVFIRLCLTGPV